MPAGTPVSSDIQSPVYVSNLPTTDPNYGKWNLDEAFKGQQGFSRTSSYDGLSYTIHFPSSWKPDSEQMTSFVDSILWANNQIGMWEAVLAQNEKEKVEMQHKGNYSFGGGATIEYSEATASNSSYTHTWGFNITPTIGLTTGVDINGVGIEIEVKGSLKAETGGSTGSSTGINKTTGFVLAEEGTVDEITVDYGYTESGTFAFKTRGGQTSCPYEGEVLSKYYQPGQHILQEATMQVEVPVIEVSSAAQVLNVPANRTAIFTLALQNESQTNNDVWFMVAVDEATNPNGAELKIDGIGIGNGRTFLVRAGEVLTKTLAISKGTVDDYDNIGIILKSLCEPETVADTAWVTAHFVPACSDVAISAPANNFIVNTASPSENGVVKLSVTLQNFDVNFPNFGYICLEYRAAGTPVWTTARTFYPDHLFNSPTNTDGTGENIRLNGVDRAAITYEWPMPTADGQYELRATTASVNIVSNAIGTLLSTYSTNAIVGYKDMTKPQALGAPSPANGIYGAGDELSVTFNEDIQTSMVISNNITVTYDNNIAVPITFVTSANKITMEYPGDYFSILEGKTLNIKVKDIYDMRGNRSDTIAWTALVNRNALVWETDLVNLTKEAGNSLTFTAKIKNAGNQTVSYSIVNLPQWLSVNQPTGTLQPLSTRELTFTISSGVNLGSYTEQIGVTSGNSITKNLPLQLTVTGILPEGWEFNPADYESTMTVTGRIQIEGVYQTDTTDILAAFIGDECVGLTSPIRPSNNGYYTFLTVHGNAAHAGQAIKFKVWDASTGNVYSVIESKINDVMQNFTFTANAIKGDAGVPVIHNALNMVEQSIALQNGWNWISVNVLNTNPTIIQQFKDRVGTAGEMLKGQTGYIQNPSWTGTLTGVEKEQMYLVKTNAATTLHFDGTPAVAASSPITLANGWNWIGYIPQFTLPVNEALANLAAQTNDQIKGHNAYRVYASASAGWVGNLNYMRAGEGYMYNSGAAASKTFNYPSTSSQVYHAPVRASSAMTENRWQVDIHKYSSTMTMTSVVVANSVELQSEQIEVAAFDSKGECRGSAVLQNVPQNSEHPYLGFLMVFGESSENLTLKVYDHATGTEYTASNVVSFATDAIHGNPAEPYRIQFVPTGIDEISIEQVVIYPNPVADVLNIASGSLRIKNVKIMDALGKIIRIDDALKSNTINVSNLTSGLYAIQITTDNGVVTKMFVKK
ncbi:hypothetical protein AGMMS50239_23270 [Bacteroidia bacterium]|nr:hypothetical protein AGMMS50239_23270 [Bacteroidia bacterium]